MWLKTRKSNRICQGHDNDHEGLVTRASVKSSTKNTVVKCFGLIRAARVVSSPKAVHGRRDRCRVVQSFSNLSVAHDSRGRTGGTKLSLYAAKVLHRDR